MLLLSLFFVFLFPLLFSIFDSVSVSALALASPSILPLPPSINICSTNDPSPLLRSTHDLLRAQHRRDKKENKDRIGRRQVGLGRRDTGTGADPGTPLVVDVYMHFVTSTDQARRYNPQIIETFTSRQVCLMTAGGLIDEKSLFLCSFCLLRCPPFFPSFSFFPLLLPPSIIYSSTHPLPNYFENTLIHPFSNLPSPQPHFPPLSL